MIIAHRGASAEAPENTLSSFKAAFELGVDYIELDVQLSADQIPIVVHDDSTDRVTQNAVRQKIAELTCEQLQSLDVGKWFSPKFKGEPMPTLAQVLALARGTSGVMIEIKESPLSIPQMAYAVLKVIEQEKQIAGPVVIASFNPKILEYIQKKTPEKELLGLIETEEDLKQFEKLHLTRLGVNNDILTISLAKRINKKYSIWCWTVDSLERATTLIEWGIQGIITNNPRMLKNYFTKNM